MKRTFYTFILGYLLLVGCGKEEKEEIISSSRFLAIGETTYVFSSDQGFWENEKEWNPDENLPLGHQDYARIAGSVANTLLGEKNEWRFTGISIREGYKEPWSVVVSLEDKESTGRFAMIPMSINGTPLPSEETDLPVEDLTKMD